MDYFLDLQGFYNNTDQLIVKELSIISSDDTKSYHILYKPPYSFSHLSLKSQKTAKWLRLTHHGLTWQDGTCDLSTIGELINSLNASKIYVKSLLKKIYIKSLLKNNSIQVINLEDYGCPSLAKLRQHYRNINGVEKCQFSHSVGTICANENVKIISKWWKDRLQTKTITINIHMGERCNSHYAWRNDKNNTDFDAPNPFVINCQRCIEEM